VGAPPVRRRPRAGEATADWPHATPFEGTDSYGVLHEIGIADDTKRVGFIVHGNGDTGGNPDTKDPAGAPDRFFIPALHARDLAAPRGREDLQLPGGRLHLRGAVRIAIPLNPRRE
jgi:hypothetical protein